VLVKGKQSSEYCQKTFVKPMEVNEAKVDSLFGHQPVESDVKLEPSEQDIKSHDIKIDDVEVPTSTSVWSFLVKRSRYLYQVEHGRTQICPEVQTKLTVTLLREMQQLLNEVSGFVRSCCDQHPGHEMHEEGCIALEDQVAQSCLLEKGTKLHVIIGNPPSNYHEDLFSQFKAECKNQMLLKNDINCIPLPSFSSLPPLPPINSFNESEDDDEDDNTDDDIDASFDNNSNSGDGSSNSNKFAQYPRPKIVPVDYNKKKQVCVCEQCGGSWSRKEYYYHHKSVGKCTPKWIRYSAKNKNRIRCVHPDCESKKEVNFTYAGIMKHIIELHTSQESATLQCPDCNLKFPMKAVLKFHQDSAHQAHAMICTICGKIVRDMRKHKLVHATEKPFQCDRCSYRCSRSGTLRRHMATHLNTDPMKINHVIDNTGLQQQQQHHQQQPQQLQQQPQLQLQPRQGQQQHIELQPGSLDGSIPIHIPHHEANQLQEPKYIELTTQQLAQHLPPHSTYSSPPPPPTATTNLTTVAWTMNTQ